MAADKSSKKHLPGEGSLGELEQSPPSGKKKLSPGEGSHSAAASAESGARDSASRPNQQKVRVTLEAEAHESDSSEAHRRKKVDKGTYGDFELEPTEQESAMAAAAEADEEEVDEEHVLDAWYASFATPSTRAMLRRQVEEGRLELVIGPDDRKRIDDTDELPWRMICSLKIKAMDNSNWIGTGWFAGPRLIVTAGHCVFMRDNGGWVREIEVIPGRNGSSPPPFGSYKSKTLRSPKGWTVQNDRNYDYGAILLKDGAASPVWFGYSVLDDTKLMQANLNISGYPGDKPAGTQWYHSRRTQSVTGRTIVYDVDTAGGQSGAPVWIKIDNKRVAVGIHTNGSTSGNSATRIIEPLRKNLDLWFTQAGE